MGGAREEEAVGVTASAGPGRVRSVLVTGGAGFIGSNFIHYLRAEHPEWRVVNLDLLTYAGNLENLTPVEGWPGYRFVRGDVCHGELVEGLLREEGIEWVINFAAESHVDRSIMGADSFVRSNVQGTLALLEASRRCGVERYLQVSTDEVYGSVSRGACREDASLAPSSPYAASKAGADLLCGSYWVTHGLPVLITRASNTFGPYQFPEKFIPLAINNLLQGESIPVYGTGENIRDWLYAEDHCRGIDTVLRTGRPGQIYHLASQEERANLEIARRLCRLVLEGHAGTDDIPEEDAQEGTATSRIRLVRDRPGHDLRYALDTSKIKEELGWEPRYDFDEALAQTVEWYRSHTEWWRRVRSGAYREYYQAMYGDR